MFLFCCFIRKGKFKGKKKKMLVSEENVSIETLSLSYLMSEANIFISVVLETDNRRTTVGKPPLDFDSFFFYSN